METGARSLNFGHNTFIKNDRTETSLRASLIFPAKKGLFDSQDTENTGMGKV